VNCLSLLMFLTFALKLLQLGRFLLGSILLKILGMLSCCNPLQISYRVHILMYSQKQAHQFFVDCCYSVVKMMGVSSQAHYWNALGFNIPYQATSFLQREHDYQLIHADVFRMARDYNKVECDVPLISYSFTNCCPP